MKYPVYGDMDGDGRPTRAGATAPTPLTLDTKAAREAADSRKAVFGEISEDAPRVEVRAA